MLVLRPPVRAADIEFVTEELPWAVVDKGYAPPPLEARASGACPSGGISYAVVSGMLPPGLELSRAGYLSGIPSQTGPYEIAVRVSNGCTWTTKHFILTVAGAPGLWATPPTLEFRWSLGQTLGQTAAAEEQLVRVSATWGRLPYQVTSNAEWLTATPVLGFTRPQDSPTAEDTVRVRVDAKHLKAGRYEGVVTVSAWQAWEALRIAVQMTVIE